MWPDNGYAYAKASWIVGKSFLGKRLPSLNGIHTLNELDRLIFPDHHIELPTRELLGDLEKRIINRAVRRILSVVNSYTAVPKLLVRMLKGLEYENLKETLSSIADGKNELPALYNIGRFGSIRFNAFPDVALMLKKTGFEHLLLEELKSVKIGMDLTALYTKLDHKYYHGLIESLTELDSEEREAASRLLADEITLRNCAWALRLRTYYHKSETETAKYLLGLKTRGLIGMRGGSLASDALASLEYSLDVRQEWKGWRWERFLNTEEESSHWTADPRHFQNAASGYLNHLAYHGFHSYPMSVSAIYCFIKLVQYEEDLLTSVAEGLSLGMDSSSVFKLLEVA